MASRTPNQIEKTRTRSAPVECLYCAEREIARRLGIPIDEWRALAVVLEREGLPIVDPLFGRRYWPAVKAFLDRRAGITASNVAAVPDGKENWS